MYKPYKKLKRTSKNKLAGDNSNICSKESGKESIDNLSENDSKAEVNSEKAKSIDADESPSSVNTCKVEEEEEEEKDEEAFSNPLHMFGVLVPSSLKEAQMTFRETVLRQVLTLAVLKRELSSLVHGAITH